MSIDLFKKNLTEAKLDKLGKEDDDVDNDGDTDDSDTYLLKRRKAISKAIAKQKNESVEAEDKNSFLDEGESISAKLLKKIEKMSDLDDAKKAAIDAIEKSRTAARKKARLIEDIKKMTQKKQLLKTMWNALLAGSGMGSVSSNYKTRMAEGCEDTGVLDRTVDDFVNGRINDVEAIDRLEMVGISTDDAEDIVDDYFNEDE